MKFTVETKLNLANLRKMDAILVPISKNAKPAILKILKPDEKVVKELLAAGKVVASKAFLLKSRSFKGFLVLILESEWTEKKIILAFRQFVRLAKKEGFKNVGLAVSDFLEDRSYKSYGSYRSDGSYKSDRSYKSYRSDKSNTSYQLERLGQLISENALLAHFDFSEEFKKKPAGGWRRVQSFTVFSREKAIKTGLKTGELIGKWTNRARILCNYPPSHMKPEGLAEAARTISEEIENVGVTVFDERRLRSEGMNAILSVGQGSAAPPRLIIMEYKGDPSTPLGASKPLVLVGKGITFDSGGINLKPTEGMADMHMDMSGAASVMAAIALMAELKLPINVVGILPCAENMISGISYRQGDVVTAYGGKTIEIGNTDAEGRVVMADAIEYAKIKKPALIFTLATLTGASMQALGLRMSALFVKNNHELQDALQEIGDISGDLVWPLPLTEESEQDVEGNFADLTNTSKDNTRWGWALLGAAFLSQFAKPLAFAHIDMAPRMKTIPKEEYLSEGSAGFGVRYFAEVAKNWPEIKKLL